MYSHSQINDMPLEDIINILNNLSNEESFALFKVRPATFMKYLSVQKRITMLSDPLIKSLLIDCVSTRPNTSSTYSIFIDSMTEEEFHIFMNEETLKLLENNPSKKDYAIMNILTSKNPAILESLKDNVLTQYIIKHIDDYYVAMEHLSSDTAIFLYKKLLSYDLEKMYPKIFGFNEKVQLAVINSLDQKTLNSLTKHLNFFYSLDTMVISSILEKKFFKEYFLQLPKEIIIKLILEGIVIPSSYTNNKKFIEILSSIDSTNLYRFLILKIDDSSYNNTERFNWIQERAATEAGQEIESDYRKPRILTEERYNRLFDPHKIEEAREDFYDKKITKIKNSAGLMPKYYNFYEEPTYEYLEILDIPDNFKIQIRNWLAGSKNKVELFELLDEFSTKELYEMLIDRYYKDVPYNFLINLQSVLHFFNSIDITKLKMTEDELYQLKNRLRRYQQVLNFYDMTRKEQINFYLEFDRKKDYALEFSEDFSLAKTTSYEMLNEVVFNPDKDTQLINKELSEKCGVTIFELSGEPFYTFEHVTAVERKSVLRNPNVWQKRLDEFKIAPLDYQMKTMGASISFTSDKKMESFRPVKDYVTFGFKRLLPNRIAHVYHTDSHSLYYRHGIGMNKITEILTPEQLDEQTIGYNEILYQEINLNVLDPNIAEHYEELVPDYIKCYDEITPFDIFLAQNMGIDILLVHTKYYHYEKKDYNHYNHENEYAKDIHDIENITTYRKK